MKKALLFFWRAYVLAPLPSQILLVLFPSIAVVRFLSGPQYAGIDHIEGGLLWLCCGVWHLTAVLADRNYQDIKELHHITRQK